MKEQEYQRKPEQAYTPSNVKDSYKNTVVDKLEKPSGSGAGCLDALLDDVDSLISKDNLAKDYVQQGGQ